MELSKRLEATSHFLFRHRGTLPAGTLLLFLLALNGYTDANTPAAVDFLWETGLIGFILAGIAVRVVTVGAGPPGTSGRNTRTQVADALNTTGIYSLLRHPLYVGNFFIFLGIALFPQNGWVAAVCVLAFWLFYLPIMMAEEEFLRRKFGAAFLEWTRHTPAILPLSWRWRRSDRGFSWRKALRREYQTVYAVIWFYVLLDMTEDYFHEGLLLPDRELWILLGVSTFPYLVLLAISKRTRWLEDDPPAPAAPSPPAQPA
jgi:protein-S-isoprenylcysteine O-methyltransferase Ste14